VVERITSNAPYAIGADLGVTHLRAALVRRDGAILEVVRERAAPYDETEQRIDQLCALLRALLQKATTAGRVLAGVGVGMAGQINLRGEVIGGNAPREFYATRGSPTGILPVARQIEERLVNEIPVHVTNDAKAATLGEHRYGAGRGCQQMIGLTVGTGVGGGLILNGKLYHGAAGLAGHLGLMPIDLHGPPCPSGVPGCLEHYASGTGIARMARQALRAGRTSHLREVTDDVETVTSEQVFAALDAGDALAREVIEAAAYALGIGIVGLLHVFNPEKVVIGGGVVAQGARFLAPVRRAVAQHSMMNFDATPIVRATLGDQAGVVGAAALCWTD
jgi:glucokinase